MPCGDGTGPWWIYGQYYRSLCRGHWFGRRCWPRSMLWSQPVELDKEEKKKILEEELKEIEREKQIIEKKLKELETE